MKSSTAAVAAMLVLTVPTVLSLDDPGVPTPAPASGGPVLLPDSEWEATSWGFKLKDFDFDASREWPTIFYMEGYSGAGRPNAYLRMDDGVLIALRFAFAQGPDGAYATARASIRGTECSGGEYSLYDRRHAWDGHHVIEWIADEEWSNGNVGMIGWSYSGQTAYWVASTQPPSLKAVSANLLHSDIYRDIFMPGGVQNYAFPVVWTYGLGVVGGAHRIPVTSLQNGAIPEDEVCTFNQATRTSPWSPPQPQLEPLWAGIGATDNDWYAAHAATTYAPAIRIPFYQQTNWNDEQTGPRAAVLWHYVHPDPVTVRMRDGDERTVIPKVMRTSNGDHGWGEWAANEMWAWFDVFLRDMPDRLGILEAPVANYFEASADGESYSAKKTGADWPFPDTTWTRLFARDGGVLSADAPTGDESEDSYVSAAPRRGNWFFYASEESSASMTLAGDLPDAVSYSSAPLEDTLVVAGPIVMDLHASVAGADADFFVSLADVHPDGSVAFVQRGLLKASHRIVDEKRSWFNDAGDLVQPYRPHTNPEPLTPGEAEHFAVEVFPVGHVFRPGHRVLVQVHAPPIIEGLWGYTPTHHQPAVVSVHHDAARPTSILLPVVTPDGPVGPPPLACGVPGGFPCVEPNGGLG